MKQLSTFTNDVLIGAMSAIGILCSCLFIIVIGHYIGLLLHNTAAGEIWVRRMMYLWF